MATGQLENILRKYRHTFHQVIDFNSTTDKVLRMDLSENNKNLDEKVFGNSSLFSLYIDNLLASKNCKFGIGGYLEHRKIYSISDIYNSDEKSIEPRRLHLGIDIWGQEGSPVYAFLGGMVHSFAFNKQFGDYGATIILLHQLDSISFYTLYGHLRLADIENIEAGNYIVRGQQIGGFGLAPENGGWPPHLHFQVISNLEMNIGDYPGVCSTSNKAKYEANCPNPDLILQIMKYAIE